MPASALFTVELLTQIAEAGLATGDPQSAGTVRVTLGGIEVWNDEANLTSSALCLLRTTRGDFAGPIEGVSDTNPLIQHCGSLPETSCPIGASWRVRHAGGEVQLDRVVRACEIGADEPVAGLPVPIVMSRDAYTAPIRAFAIAVRSGIEREAARDRGATDPIFAHTFAAFWNEFDALLAAPELTSTGLSAERIGAELAAAASPFVEAAPGMWLFRVCPADESAAIVARAGSAAWTGATINADRSIDRAIRDAEVLDEARDDGLTERLREQLFRASREIAARHAPGSVLAEVQVVRYVPGGHYADHRDSPALGATPRALSIVWYLNDDFAGGETRFSTPDIVVSPVSGVAIAFSPVLMHRAEPVAAGTKYAVTAWYHDVPGA